MVRVTENTLGEAGKRMKEFFKNEAPKIAANALRPRIISRTNRGVDSSGNRFVKYSQRYAKYFRKPRELQTSPVNLTVTGDMKNSLQYYENIQTQEGRGHALAIGKDENARAMGNQNTREWVGVHPSDPPVVSNAIVTGFNSL